MKYLDLSGLERTANKIKALINAKYSKPGGGIPKTDLDSNVQNSLNKTDNISGYYGTSSTGATTAAKVVTCENFVLETGAVIYVKFTNANSYNGTATLNVNNTGAIDIARVGTTKTTRYYWSAGEVVGFVYDGTNYVMMERGTSSTTYYGLTKLSSSATSTSEALALTPKSLNSFAQGVVVNYPAYSSSSTYAVGDRVRYSYGIYECNTAITTAESWTAGHWTAVKTLQEQIDDVADSIPDVSGKEDKSNKVTSLSSSSTNTQYPSAKATYDEIHKEDVPDYVIEESESTIAKSFSHTGLGRTIRFIAVSDSHNEKSGTVHPYTQISNMHCGQAVKYISDRIGLDFVAYLGDATWAAVSQETYAPEDLRADIQQMNEFLSEGYRGIPNIRVVGNHDQFITTDNKRLGNVNAYHYFGRYCSGVKNTETGYGYYDLNNSKVRIIYLNTSDAVSSAGAPLGITRTQVHWLCQTLIDLNNKSDASSWKVLLMSHSPLDMGLRLTDVVENVSVNIANDILLAYTNGGSYVDTNVTPNITYTFTTHDAKIIGNAHGHVHCYSYGYMSNKIRRFTIPNSNFYDNNHYADKPGYEQWAEQTTYTKTQNSRTDTSFSLVTIDLDNEVCYIDNYGAGYDRVFSVNYNTNKVPTGISNINYSGTTTVGSNINVNAFTYTVTYSDSSTASKSLPVSVSPSTIGQVGNNTVAVTYTEDGVSVSANTTIVGTAAPKVNLLNMDRSTYTTLATGTNISTVLSEDVAYINILYSTSNGYAKSCTVNSYTADSISLKESGDSSICVAYAIHLPNTSKDIRVTFDYSGPNACRVYRSYADSTNLRTWAGATVYQDNTAGASGSADVTIEKASTAAGAGYDWLILMFSSNGGGSKQYSNVVVEQVN